MRVRRSGWLQLAEPADLPPSLYIENHPLCGDKLRRGWFLCALRRCGRGSGVGCRKVCCGGVFPSPAACLRASVSDGANVRCRSEVPLIVRFG